MHAFPHLYVATARTESVPSDLTVGGRGPSSDSGDAPPLVSLDTDGAPNLQSASPPQFGGPEGRWSPETLLCAALADCFVLTFRAVARASKFEWRSIASEVNGTLDRSQGVTRFTAFENRVTLLVPPGTDEARANQLVEKAEKNCLVSNSLNAPVHFQLTLEVSDDGECG
ncbi:MAG: OsmC family protein [Myxococcales bacterium]|nr:OsmC family protein [Myxococcales bacterium]